MATQVDAPYILVSPTGDRVVMGPPPWDQDPDWIGYIGTDQNSPQSSDQPITGLDSPETREDRVPKSQDSGSVQGRNLYGGRPVVLQGIMPPTGVIADLNRRQEKLMMALDAMDQDGTLTWLEDGAPWKILYVRRNVSPRITGRVVKAFFIGVASKRAEILSATENSAPLTPGDILDSFATDDSATAYTYRSGSAANLLVSGGVLSRVSGSPAFIRTLEARTFTDSEVTLKVTTGASVAAFEFGLRLKDLDANNTIEIDVKNDGIRFFKMDAGVWTNLNGPTALSPLLTTGTSYWFRARAQGNTLTLEVWTTVPDPTSGPVQSVSYVLAGADATKYGNAIAGSDGAEIDSTTPTDWTFDDLLIHPLTAATLSGLGFPWRFPLAFTMTGSIAQMSVVTSGTRKTPVWRATLTGPMQNPVLKNLTNGGELDFGCQLLAGDVMTIDADAHTVLINGVNRYSTLVGGGWFTLAKGLNDIRLNASSYGYGAGGTLYWRDAYI